MEIITILLPRQIFICPFLKEKDKNIRFLRNLVDTNLLGLNLTEVGRGLVKMTATMQLLHRRSREMETGKREVKVSDSGDLL